MHEIRNLRIKACTSFTTQLFRQVKRNENSTKKQKTVERKSSRGIPDSQCYMSKRQACYVGSRKQTKKPGASERAHVSPAEFERSNCRRRAHQTLNPRFLAREVGDGSRRRELFRPSQVRRRRRRRQATDRSGQAQGLPVPCRRFL